MKTSPTITETALPARRGKAGGASERAPRQLPRPEFSPVGSGLINALSRKVARLSAEIDEHWPLGCGTRDFAAYHKTLRRWLKMRKELERVLIEGGVL